MNQHILSLSLIHKMHSGIVCDLKIEWKVTFESFVQLYYRDKQRARLNWCISSGGASNKRDFIAAAASEWAREKNKCTQPDNVVWVGSVNFIVCSSLSFELIFWWHTIFYFSQEDVMARKQIPHDFNQIFSKVIMPSLSALICLRKMIL
jgi:hypothetical protein